MKEITYTDREGNEVMVNIEEGDITRLYTSPLSELTERFKFTPGKNPFFVHADNPRKVWQWVHETHYLGETEERELWEALCGV